MRRTVWFAAALVFVAVMALSGPSFANKGFYIGTGLGLAFPNQDGDVLDEIEPQSGMAWEILHLGYNFTDNVGVGMNWGGVSGPVDEDKALGDDTVWGTGYMGLAVRGSYPLDNNWTPYGELGFGSYSYNLMGDDADFVSDPATGLRLGFGANYYFNNIYVAPELSFHFVEYEEGEVDIDDAGKYDRDFEETGNFMLLLVKAGYHWKKN